MSKEVKQIIPCALRPESYVTQDCIEHSEQSALLRAGDLAIVLRPFGEVSGFTQEQEFNRRVQSTRMFENKCPDVALPTDHVIMDGVTLDSPEENIRLLLRVAPWIEEARPMTIIPLDDITSEESILNQLTQINKFVFLQGLRGRVYDIGLPNEEAGDSSPLHNLIRRLYMSNIMIGIDPETGIRRVFFDPDWFSMLSDPDQTPRTFEYYKRRVLIRSLTAFTFFSSIRTVRKLQRVFNRLRRI